MRILADENFPGQVVEALGKQGHDVLWARADCPGWTDSKLLNRAEAEARVLFTLDKDFWQLALQRPNPLHHSGVILIRALPATPENVQHLVDSVLRIERHWNGHLSIVTKDGIEMIPTRGSRLGST